MKVEPNGLWDDLWDGIWDDLRDGIWDVSQFYLILFPQCTSQVAPKAMSRMSIEIAHTSRYTG